MLESVAWFLSHHPSAARERDGQRPAAQRTRATRALALLCAALFVVVGCAGPGSPRTSTGVADPAAPAAAKVRTITAATSFPIVAFSGLSIGGPRAVFGELHSDGLATTDAQARPVPRIAPELPSLERGTTRLLPDGRMTTEWKIRPDVTWHDGAPFTARDVAFGFRVHSDPELAFPEAERVAISRIEAVDPIDDHTVLIRWNGPFYLANALVHRSLVPLPAHILQAAYEAGDKQRFESLPYWTSEYVHAGAFRLVHYEQGVGASFEAYDRYFLGRPKVDRVVIREILDANAAYAAVLSGDVDMTIEIFDGERATSLQEQWEGAGRGKVLSTPGSLRTGHFQLASELADPPELLDPRIRRALYLALDRKALTDLGWGGRPAPGAEATGLFPSSNLLYAYVGDNFAKAASDPVRARQELADAGWTPGSDGMLVNATGARLPVEIRVAQNRLTQAVVMADMWKQVGVEATSAAIPAALANNREYNQAFPGVYLLSGSPLDSGLVKFDGNEVPTARNGYRGSNPGHYSNPQVTELIERFRVTINESQRGQFVKQAAEHITQDMPVVALFHNPQYATVVRGVRALSDLDGAKTSITAGYARTAHLWEKE